jgi:rare lipoprotein A
LDNFLCLKRLAKVYPDKNTQSARGMILYNSFPRKVSGSDLSMIFYSQKTLKRLLIKTGFTMFPALVWGCASVESTNEIDPSGASVHPAPISLPYQVNGISYYPVNDARGYVEEGIASWYGPGFHGKQTSNRETYDMNALTAAHKTLPFNTKVKVTRLDGQADVIVRINDRGPFVNGRIIDLSYAAAKKLSMIKKGTIRVRLTVLDAPKAAEMLSPPTFAVQVAVFQTQGNAWQMKLGLENSRVQPYFVGQKQLYRVLVGEYSNFEMAEEVKNDILEKGFTDAFIIMESIPLSPKFLKH